MGNRRRRGTAWYAAQAQCQNAARDSTTRWLPPCDDADIRRIWLRISGEWLDSGFAALGGERIGAMLARLETEIARERGRSRSGHRSYDFNKHIAYCQVRLALQTYLESGKSAARSGKFAAPAGLSALGAALTAKSHFAR